MKYAGRNLWLIGRWIITPQQYVPQFFVLLIDGSLVTDIDLQEYNSAPFKIKEGT